jgi:hypothetical protein
MRYLFNFSIILIIIALIILVIPDKTAAQSVWLHSNHDQTLTLEVIIPDFKKVHTMSRVRDSFNLYSLRIKM